MVNDPWPNTDWTGINVSDIMGDVQHFIYELLFPKLTCHSRHFRKKRVKDK